MKIHRMPMSWYVDRLKVGDRFSFVGYSDAEWYSMMQLRLNTTTGLGQHIDATHGKRLLRVMRERQCDRTWLFAVPSCLSKLPLFEKYPIDTFLEAQDIRIEGYERDMVLDDLAKNAGLYPFIRQLQAMDTVVIGPRELEGLAFLDYKQHFPIASPNLHMEPFGIQEVVGRVLRSRVKDAVYLVSAGVSAAVIIDRLCTAGIRATFMDCGSIWDAFVGIGGQREWRAELYADPAKLEAWKHTNLTGEV